MRVIGLMSGTSLDGIDAALVDIDGRERPDVTVRAFTTFPFPEGLHDAVLAGIAHGSAETLCRLNFRLAEAFADAALALIADQGLTPADVDLVGSHGQTLWHAPEGPWPSTLQLGDPSVVAQRTGITTVGDFRPADMALGGQGAPLVPFVDRLLFWRPGETLALQNLGGMANVTYIDAEGHLLAFDTGPGNVLLDRIAERAFGTPYDAGGDRAATGHVDEALLAELLAHPFLAMPPPKSTGREVFGASFADALLARGLRPEDLLATATAFTAESVADAYHRHLPSIPPRMIVSGGGAHNRTLLSRLGCALPGTVLVSSDDSGIPADAKEAVAFAVLACCTVLGVPNSVPSATGSREPAVLGRIAPGRNYRRCALAPRRPSTPDGVPATEAVNPMTEGLDKMAIPEALAVMHVEDGRAVAAIEAALPQIADAVDAVARALRAGGRLLYVGAGTSGRLGVLDASECPPTFLVAPDRVQGIIAGGAPALTTAVEGAEDDERAGAAEIRVREVGKDDVVIGISASGGAPFVRGALAEARGRGATTGLVSCNPLPADMQVNLPIVVEVGPEVLAGSTRLKAGTATKLVLNMLSTLAMVQLGKTYGNLMVDVHASNAKLRRRANRLVQRLAGLGEAEADTLLREAGMRVKTAVAMHRLGISREEAEARLAQVGGRLRALIG